MTLSQIQCFLVVAEKMSITEAANTLFVTQPAVSHRISKLEQELGCELFYRDNSRIVLTLAGNRYVEFFSDFVNGLKKISAELKGTDVIEEKVVIGSLDGWEISSAFHKTKEILEKDYPGITLRLECYGHDTLIEKMANRQLDMVLALDNVFAGINDMEITPIRKLKGTVLFSDHHPLAGKEDLCFSDFRDYPLYVALSPKNRFAISEIVQYCLGQGFKPKTEYVDTINAALVKMRTENGVMISDEYFISNHSPFFRVIDVPDLTRSVCLGVREKESRAYAIVKHAFLDALRESFDVSE